MKERFLTVLVPIKDDVATPVETLPDVDPDNINVIYKHNGVYKRVWFNPETNQYEYHEVIDREFPYLGRPLEIFNFTYDATRMGTAPTISAQGVMWFADKDENGNDVTLEGLWSQECHVSFNGENYYLKLIPTSTKSNEDARYKYDLDFVSERIVLETVYLYDVVTPFVTERPISESSEFSFYGDISELAKRINSSLLRIGLATLQLQDGVSESDILTYEEWNQIGLGTYTGDKPIRKYIGGQGASPYRYFYPYYGGNYSAYLRGEIYATVDGEFVMYGYQCKIGRDKKGEQSTSEEKLITFDKNTIHEALQEFHDTFGLQYYITRELDGTGAFTGNTLIMVADCEHDFADLNEQGTDYVRDEDNIPTTEHPFNYGVDDALLSKEKTNTTDKIITRITGVGSEENIPWYYPNPTADGWIKPVYKVNGEVQDIEVEYQSDEGETGRDNVLYEKYLKNRIGDVFQYGKKILALTKMQIVDGYDTYVTSIDENHAYICYDFSLQTDSRVWAEPFVCSYEDTSVSYVLFKGATRIIDESYVFLKNGGAGNMEAGDYHLIFIITFNGTGPTPISTITKYYYPAKNITCGFIDTWKLSFLVFALTSFGTGLALLTINALISDLKGGWNSSLPGFFSTNPNLKFVASSDASKVGWYNGGRRIEKSEMEFGTPNSEHYAFLGGNGPQTVGEGDVYKVTYGARNYCRTYNTQMKGYDITKPYDVYCLITDFYGISGGGPTCIDTPISVEEVDVDVNMFISEYISYGILGFVADGWYKNNKKCDLADYGITEGSGWNPDVFDTIEFQRLKYVTPQPTLMPEVYVKTDGERRFYNAVNYPLSEGTPDPMIGEVESEGLIVNPLYYKEGTDTHYDFENEYMANMPKEHIESFEDIKPSIKGQTNYFHVASRPDDWVINYRKYYRKNSDGEYLPNTSPNWNDTTIYVSGRIDVVEEFAYDELDNDEIWESNENGNVSGEYKHPYFFAKLRPLGFNIFDLALQDDMVISMTTGHCGACNFKIGVDENTKKNPVQIWEYDVYEGSNYDTKVFKYRAGDLRRYVDISNLYYDTTPGDSDGYILVDSQSNAQSGFIVDSDAYTRTGLATMFRRDTYSEEETVNGEVGALKKDGKNHFDGDVKVNGKFIESQQDTSENYVWVALMKDTETYGTIMPSARPDYADHVYDVFIRPKSVADVHIDENVEQETVESTREEDEENADKFVIINIRMPQVYLRRAEGELSRRIIEYMYDNNYQKFNFSIKFSRIFLAQNAEVDGFVNENSVLYVSFNNATYRQYVKHYTYRMAKDVVLPEINVDMNEELGVSRTLAERQSTAERRNTVNIRRNINRAVNSTESRIERKTVGRNEDVIVNGNLISRDSLSSINKVSMSSRENTSGLFDTQVDLEANHYKKSDFVLTQKKLTIGGEINVPTKGVFDGLVSKINTFNGEAADKLNQIKSTVEYRLLPLASPENDILSCSYTLRKFENGTHLFWYNSTGDAQIVPEACPVESSRDGMSVTEWEDFDAS